MFVAAEDSSAAIKEYREASSEDDLAEIVPPFPTAPPVEAKAQGGEIVDGFGCCF